MKKILIFSSAFLGIFLLTACGLKDQFVQEPDLISMTGILSEQKNVDKENGTHFLTNETGEKKALRSVIINLSGDEYLNNKVQVMGFTNEDDNVFEVTGISVLEIFSEKTKQNKLIDYKNTEAGFQLKYYDDWKVDEQKNGNVVFIAPLKDTATKASTVIIQQYSFEYTPETSEDALSAYYKKTTGNELKSNMINKIGVDQIDAIKNVTDDGVDYTLYRSGFVYQVIFTQADPVNSDDEKVFNQMITEFRFIAFDAADSGDIDEVSENAPADDLPKLDMELTSFESLPYKFKGKYPAKWYYAGKKSKENDVLHHYGFSDEAVTDDNEIITLDVLADSVPKGKKLSVSGKDLVEVQSGNTYIIYVTVGGQNYRMKGPKEYENLILNMAVAIEAVSDL